MPFDYKKEYKEFYLPGAVPKIVEIPAMNFVAVRGQGDPNEAGGAYQEAVGILYGVSYALKMSPKSGRRIQGFFDYVVPPLEGLWRQEGREEADYAHKEDFLWVSLIRLPEFVTPEDFDWAVAEAARKKKQDFSKAEFFSYEEGLCVQCMHLGPYDSEPATIRLMEDFAAGEGWVPDMDGGRLHHEIYLGDPRKCAPEKLRTVIRHPVKRKD